MSLYVYMYVCIFTIVQATGSAQFELGLTRNTPFFGANMPSVVYALRIIVLKVLCTPKWNDFEFPLIKRRNS